ncbi:MAG: hypothetical protein LBK59_02170 [Bifidobacteriaceae bacterium]|jgi:hypothetical protein|nr:hypothetical protein [Bifidobacteriaceae bacterium]
MTATTIKVSVELRDRLKAQACGAGVTLGQHLRALADLSDRDARLRSLSDAIVGTPTARLASWTAETSGWEASELADGGRDRGE